MKQIAYIHWIILAALSCVPLLLSAQIDRSPGKGSVQISLSEKWMVAEEFFNRDGNKEMLIAEYGYFATAIEAVYGISDRFTVKVNLPTLNYMYNKLPLSGQKQNEWRAGDGDIGISYSIVDDSIVSFGISLTLGIPTGTDKSILPTGDTEFDQLLSLHFHKRSKLFGMAAWWNVYGGFNHRVATYNDEWQYGLSGGVFLDDGQISVSGQIEGVSPVQQAREGLLISAESLFAPYRQYLRVGPEIAFYPAKDWRLTIGFSSFISGKNILAGTMYEAGVSYQW